MSDDLEDALDALESMVGQYLGSDRDMVQYDHDFMSAGEEACEVLARLRPHRWRLIPTGVVQTGSTTVQERWTRSDEPLSPETEAAIERIMQRVQARELPPSEYTVSYLVDPVADMEKADDLVLAVNAVHHWLAMGAIWVSVHRRKIDEEP